MQFIETEVCCLRPGDTFLWHFQHNSWEREYAYEYAHFLIAIFNHQNDVEKLYFIDRSQKPASIRWQLAKQITSVWVVHRVILSSS